MSDNHDDENGRVFLPIPVHPSEQVNEYLEAFGWSREELASRAKLPLDTVIALCEGRSDINEGIASALSSAFERPEHFWRNLQRKYDLRKS